MEFVKKELVRREVLKVDRLLIKDLDSLPVLMTPAEINKSMLRVSQLKLYQLLNAEGCPRLCFGRKYLIPTAKFIEWLESRASA